jgi:hypothetical protein
LRRHRRQHAADQAHVVIERQPRDAAVVGLNVEPVVNHAEEIAEHRVLRNHYTAGEARAPRRVLQMGRLCGSAWLQLDLTLGQLVERGRGSRKREAYAVGRFV